MFNTLLIANRGEIACRIARTARRMGLRTVAVYSEVDRESLHVEMCDVAVCIGPAEASLSYLNVKAIVEAAHATGAQAVHPGYGFLSESLALIDACEVAGLIFVGPSREAIRCMGSKIESKKIAQKSGVPVVPGYYGDDQDEHTLMENAERIGFPVLIKASAGGGGKGMRIVNTASNFSEALAIVRREAKASFGDDQVLLERYIAKPRHLEVQLLGDQHGNLVHLFERECSVQRNYQKVLEEAPAGFLNSKQRDELYTYALEMGRAIDYYTVGTVEFIHDAHSNETFFLEMNTRIQVEHPVTEAIVGIDLVEWQLRVASGEALTFQQNDLHLSGWAIEARVCAENPATGFTPEIGIIAGYREPDLEGIRVDSGVGIGSHISPTYDSMLAKVIAFADTREQATRRLVQALDTYELLGVRSNLGFLGDLLRHPSFELALSTQYIDSAFPTGWNAGGDTNEALAITAIGGALIAHQTETSSPWRTLGAWRVLGDAAPYSMQLLFEDAARNIYEANVSRVGGQWFVKAGDYNFDCKASLRNEQLKIERNGIGKTYRFLRVRDAGDEYYWLVNADGVYAWRRVNRWQHALTYDNEAEPDEVLRAPMPGLITAVSAELGCEVRAGDSLVQMEAMKMLYTLAAPIDGYVAELRCRVGDAVNGGDILIVMQ